MATTTFYCIKNGRDRYLEGAPIDYNFWRQIGDARKFRAISDIRSFMTRMLKHPGNLDITDWYIERHTVDDSYPITDIFTSSHTMALLKHQNTV